MTAATPTRRLVGTPTRRRNERLVKGVLLLAAILSIAISAGIVLSLIFEAATFLGSIELSQLWTDGWFPRRGMFDIPTLLIGSLLVTGIAMLIAAPVGLLSAIYLAEYASPQLRGTVKPVLEVLAGVPSVVLGFFALTIINPYFIQNLVPSADGFNLAAAAVAVGILTVPLVATISEDSMRAVPIALREASYGLGARRVTTATRVVVPAAISGIVAAMILGISRAVGETMVVAIAAGMQPNLTFDPRQPAATITAYIVQVSLGDLPHGSIGYQSIFAAGLVLMIITLIFNIIGFSLTRRFREAY